MSNHHSILAAARYAISQQQHSTAALLYASINCRYKVPMSEPGNSLLTHLRAAAEHLRLAEQCAKELGNSAIRTFVSHAASWLGAAVNAASRMPVIDVAADGEGES